LCNKGNTVTQEDREGGRRMNSRPKPAGNRRDGDDGPINESIIPDLSRLCSAAAIAATALALRACACEDAASARLATDALTIYTLACALRDRLQDELGGASWA
jgi:hypothetical protein